MAQATELVASIRRDLAPIADRLVRHPYIAALDEGRLPREALRLFAGEQHAIITSDLRSVAHLVSRYGAAASRDFFIAVLGGEQAALAALQAFAHALGLTDDDLQAYEPQPGAHAYTCYMAWLGAYGSDAEVAAAYVVNFPAWGQNCGRLSRILKERYGLAEADVAFFDHFAAPAPEFEPAALAVIGAGLARGNDPRLIHRAARLLQAYELLYWDTLSEASSPKAS